MKLRASWLTALLAFTSLSAPVSADPWLAPGDMSVRADIQLLSDAGILRGPVTTWPISWPDVSRDALAASAADLDQSTANALMRIQRMSRAASARGYAGPGLRIRAASERFLYRDFEDTPREEAELGLRAGWLTDHVALNLQGSYVANPQDGKRFRPDGSYLGVNFGNYMLSAGLMERWWGPGWDGSLILSSNARPMPTVTLERNYTDPFDSRWLSWIGHWRASIAVGQAESGEGPVPDVRFFAARVNFRPRAWIEFGLTRTAQWCGNGRPCGFDTFVDMFTGNDNQVADGAATPDQPGNQMAGYDVRVRSPWMRVPLAFYSQWIGEDEAGGLPSKFIALFGIETWGSAAFGGWRLRAEYTDTTCMFSRQEPQFGCAFRNPIYPQGYAYRGRIIGDSMDNDSRRSTLAGHVTFQNGDFASLTLRKLDLNRDGGDHAISRVPIDMSNVELRYSRGVGASRVTAGIGYLEPSARNDSAGNVIGFVNWQQGF